MHFNTEIIEKYQLSDIHLIVAPTSFNKLYSAYSEFFKAKIVLKFYKNNEECMRESNFLKEYQQGNIFVNLFDSIPNYRLNILEKIEPGDSYALDFPQNEDLAINALCRTVEWMKNKNIKSAADFPHVSSYRSSLKDEYEVKYKLPIAKCRRIFDDILSETSDQYLLHGDLHHENILKSKFHKDGFAVIDPKGVIGESCFELACFILNPISKLAFYSNAKNIIESRIKKISVQLALDLKYLTKWCFIKAVLSACFAIEDGLLDVCQSAQPHSRMNAGACEGVCA